MNTSQNGTAILYVTDAMDVNQITPSMLNCSPLVHLPTMQVHIHIPLAAIIP
jgi:hypothetical protein